MNRRAIGGFPAGAFQFAVIGHGIGDSGGGVDAFEPRFGAWLLYTSDAAAQRSSVDLGGGPIIKKKK